MQFSVLVNWSGQFDDGGENLKGPGEKRQLLIAHTSLFCGVRAAPFCRNQYVEGMKWSG
ncbi:MAG: hypothetical protein KBE25_09115 [Laribacter sp.]|nr:hypothetical protein [Laribacter sp.]MBP9526771.1 hypothetical protein [Laribacter sp.]MBP9609497.1 hypothetical protein [Laribacter sp.]